MKKTLIASYIHGITDAQYGERYSTIFGYFFPEFITAFLLYSVPFWIEAYWIGMLQSTSTYGTLGATSQLIHFIIKVAEALSVGTISMVGRYNGMADFERAGEVLRDAFWSTVIIGGLMSGFLYFGAYWIYYFYVPVEMIPIGVPYLRMRAINVFLMFVFLAIVGFLRGIKNTKAPMFIFILGLVVLLPIDYALIFGVWGLPCLGLQGCAVASIVQYVVMLLAALWFVCRDVSVKKYAINLFDFNVQNMKRLVKITWPMVLDKASMAFAYIWLCWMMRPLGTAAIATFTVLKDIERFSLVPAIACAQVITFLVSNDYGVQDWVGIKSNIKKVMFMASCMVFAILLFFSLNATAIIRLFDKKGDFTYLAATALPILSILVFFDLLQLVLSGALRGATNVNIVMLSRLAIIGGYFMPMSYALSRLPIENTLIRIVLIYGSFYIGNALMGVIYINRFRGQAWKEQEI